MRIFVYSVTSRKTLWILSVLAVLLLAHNAGAATVLPGTGYTNAFGTQPPAADWATLSIAGGAADTYDLDADVNTNDVTAVRASSATTADVGSPAAANSNAVWSSSGFFLQTRPNANRYNTLMGKFVNNTGTNATQINVSYLFSIAAGGVVEEAGSRLEVRAGNGPLDVDHLVDLVRQRRPGPRVALAPPEVGLVVVELLRAGELVEALGAGAEFRAPMARAVVGGLVTSSLLTLVVVPVVYTFFDDIGARLSARLTRAERARHLVAAENDSEVRVKAAS